MVRVNQVIALGAVLAFSLLTANSSLAGPAGAGGDSFTTVGALAGKSSKVWVTDPTGGGANLGEYQFRQSGPDGAEVRLCATWEQGAAQVPVSVIIGPEGLLWYSDIDGDDQIDSRIFGNPATDIPVVMDYDGDGADEIVVVRDDGLALRWIVRNTVENPTSQQAATFTFGPAGSLPVPGAWAGDGEADKPAVTKALDGGPIKLWLYGEPNAALATGSFNFGKAEWNAHAYTGSDGITRPGTSHPQGATFNVIDVATSDDPIDDLRLTLGPITTVPVGNCNL